MKNKDFGPTVSLYLETRKQKSDGTFPLKIRVTSKRERKYFAVKKNKVNQLLREKSIPQFINEGRSFSIDENSFTKATGSKPRGKYKILSDVFENILNEAKTIANGLEFFSFDAFQEKYFNRQGKIKNDVFHYFRSHIENLKNEGRIRTAVSYGGTLRALETFYGKKSLPFQTITVDFLKKFDKWMESEGVSGKGNSRTSIGINMRQLRAVFNQRPKELQAIPYPFGRGKYEIKKSQGRKIALTTDELKKIFEYNPQAGTTEQRYHDFWKLQFLCSGINITDLLQLKYKNIQDGFILFSRHKTLRTANNGKAIKIPVNDKIAEIINKHGQKPKHPDKLIFNVLENKTDPVEIDKAIMNFSSWETRWMKKIATKLGFSEYKAKKITSYSSRHSYASQLMKKSAPVAFISKQLGHTSIATTTNYLDSFEDEHLKQWQEQLTDF